jgi:hypothetical protein
MRCLPVDRISNGFAGTRISLRPVPRTRCDQSAAGIDMTTLGRRHSGGPKIGTAMTAGNCT